MGIFSRLKQKANKLKKRVVTKARTVKRKINARAPVKKAFSKIQRVYKKITPIKRKIYTPKPRVICRARASKVQQPVTYPKRKNKKSISIFDKLTSTTGKALSGLKRVIPNPISIFNKPKTILSNAIAKIKARPIKENIKDKKSIFSSIKSISQKLVGTTKNYILPVGVGLATASSTSSSLFEKFFGGTKKGIGTMVKSPFLGFGLGGFGLGNLQKTKSKVGEWIESFKQKTGEIKEKGIIDTVTDFFRGEGYAEEERAKEEISMIEEKEILTLEKQEQRTLIRNIAIVGGVGVAGLVGYKYLKK